jgi:YgiT-type zinc finger domain-containing protein
MKTSHAVRGSSSMGFWDGEACEHCGGTIEERLVTLDRKRNGHYFIIEDVPAGVCGQCGCRFFSANVLKTVEETIRGRVPPQREVAVPVFSLSK